MMTTKSTSLTIEKFLICDYFYDHYEIVVTSYACVYHPWCLGFHMLQSHTCAKKMCSKPFHHMWCSSVGFKLIDNIDTTDQHKINRPIIGLASILKNSYIQSSYYM
jgi:hypothetical protein